MDSSEVIVEIRALLGRLGVENTSNTPDFILAQYLTNCLQKWNYEAQHRDTRHGRGSMGFRKTYK